jgi:hypothetical protein
MTTEWDIVSDVFPGTQVIEKNSTYRRATRVPSTAAMAVVIVVCGAVEPMPATIRLIGGVSTGVVVISREVIKDGPTLRRAPSEVDFPTARSAEQLAKSFEAFFGPVVDRDENDQVPYAFS